jgi:hypothetical protein
VPRNAAVVAILPRSGIPHTGDGATFTVLVRNTGREELRDLTVTLEVDGQERDRDARTLPALPPGETRPVALTVPLRRPGRQVLTATVGPDELDGDNRLDVVLQVRDRVRVLVIDGAPSDDPRKSGSFFLMNALQPVRDADRPAYHVQPRQTVPRRAGPGDLADKDVCILADVPLKPDADNLGGHLSPDFLARLGSFVKEGRGLMIFSGPHVKPAAYNELLADKLGLLPLRLGAPYTAKEEQPLFIDPDSADPHGFLASFGENPYADSLRKLVVLQALDTGKAPDVAGAEPPQVALRYTNGRPAVVSRRVGRGRVVLCTTSGAVDLRWGVWPLQGGTFLPLIDRALDHVLEGRSGEYNRRAGEAIVWYPPALDEGRPFDLKTPDGEDVRLGPAEARGSDRPAVRVADTARAGIYRLAPVARSADEVPNLDPEAGPREPPGALFALAPDLRESANLDSLTPAEIDEQLGIKAVHLSAQGDEAPGAERAGGTWTRTLLLFVLLLVLVEAALAWFCGRAW